LCGQFSWPACIQHRHLRRRTATQNSTTQIKTPVKTGLADR
jgi:hypothetical protein